MRLLLFLLPICLYGQVLTSNHTSCGSATPLMTNGVDFDCAFTGANSNPSIIIVNPRVVLNTIPTTCVVTDTAGNTYSQIGPNEPDGIHAILFAFWAKNTSTSTITVHLNCTWNPMLQASPIQVRDSIQEFTGVDSIDQIGATILPTTGIGVINAQLGGTTITPTELIWSAGQTNQGASPITGSDTAIEDAGLNFMLSQYRVVGSTCQCSATVNFTTTGVASMIIASFYQSGASISNVNIKTTSAQAVISYAAPTTARCTTAASTSSSMTPLFPQTDPAKFTGGLSDSQFSYLDSGQNRSIILGQKATVRGTADTVPYSLNLGVDQTYYLQTTCGAVTSPTYTLTTRAASLGQSYVDPIQADPFNPGENFNPWFDLSLRQTIMDPQTGLQVQNLSLSHDLTQCGAACSPKGLTNANVSKIGAGWTGSLPYAITNDNTSYLVFSAAAMNFFGGYPYNNNSASYQSDVMANLNWARWVITLSSTGSGDVMQGCMSENGVSCDPWGTVITCNVPTSSNTCTFGTGTTQNQGGWISAGNRFRNGPETTTRSGTATCVGTTATLDTYVNHLWTNGSPITINGVNLTITAVTGDQTITVSAPCTTGAYTSTSLFWLFKMQTATAHTISVTAASSTWEGGLSPVWPDGGFWGENSFQTVNGASSQPGYLLQLVGLGLYWFNASTGATSLIGASNLGGGNLCPSNSAAWDTRANTTVLYCASVPGSGLTSFTYTPTTWADLGNLDDNAPNQFCGTVSPPCWTVTNMTAGTTLNALIAAFNPLYSTIGTNKGMTANAVTGINIHNDILIRAWSTDSTPGWIALFNPTATTNGQPGNAGCMVNITAMAPGCIVAAIPEFAAMGANNQTLRGAPLKGSMQNNAGNGIIAIGPYFWAAGSGNSYVASTNGGGPWQVGTTGGFAFSAAVGGGTGQITTCPTNPFGVSGTHCTAVPVDGQPYDPNPGPNETGARGEYLSLTAGDYLGVTNTDIELNGAELTRALVVNIDPALSPSCGTVPAPCLWLQRAVYRDNLWCGPGGGVPSPNCGFGAVAQSSAANVILRYATSQSQSFWNYVADPLGTSLLQEYDFDSRAHEVQYNGIGIDATSAQTSFGNNGCVDTSGQCYGMKIDPSGSTWNLLTRYTPVFDGVALQNPSFNGVTLNINGASGNSTQIHPSAPGSNGLSDQRRYGQDSRPFNGFYSVGGQPCVATFLPLFGKWKIAAGCAAGGGILHRKIYPTKAAWGWHPLADWSGPNCTAGLTSAMSYGVVVNANECNPGSLPGEIYFNVPWLTYPYSYFNCQSCASPDVGDITFVDASANLDSVVEFPLDDPSDRGRRSRILSRVFAPTKINAPFFEVNALPNNQWWILRTRSFLSARGDVLLIKRPVEQQDSITRTRYSTPSISLSASPGYAQIQWGYLENGADGSTKWYCTTTALNCLSTNAPTSTAPFQFSGETQAPTSCAAGCTIQPAWLPDRVAIWRIIRTDAAGAIVLTGKTQVIANP